MPLYIADYLSDTRRLSAAQHGAYLLLIMEYWQTGGKLPSNATALARLASMTESEWADAEPIIASFFIVLVILHLHQFILPFFTLKFVGKP